MKEGGEWVVNGRKIWITNVPNLDFVVLIAATGAKGSRGQVSCFIVDIPTPGFIVERKIPMIGGMFTYEILIDNMRLADSQLGMLAAAPMDRENHITSFMIDVDDDVGDQRPQQLLAGTHSDARRIPSG